MSSQPITAITVDPERDWLLDVQVDASLLRQRAKLLTPYPNPFNPQLTVPYFVADQTRVTLDVFDVRGRHVSRILDTDASPGVRDFVWTGVTDDGASVASGVYLMRMSTGTGFEEWTRVTLLK